MKGSILQMCQKALRMALVMFFGVFAVGAMAQSEIKINGTGELHLANKAASTLTLQGNASSLGDYTGYCEIAFAGADRAGNMSGAGVAVVQASNGDLLAGEVTWQMDAHGAGQITFTWCDAITLGDGTLVHSKGRFAKSRPHKSASSTHCIMFYHLYNVASLN